MRELEHNAAPCADSNAYVVRIRYREPAYEERFGAKREPYRWTFDVRATSAARAASMAVDEFHRRARLSSVGWRREVVAVEVALAY